MKKEPGCGTEQFSWKRFRDIFRTTDSTSKRRSISNRILEIGLNRPRSALFFGTSTRTFSVTTDHSREDEDFKSYNGRTKLSHKPHPLPDSIVELILLHLKRSGQVQSLCRVMRVNKQWQRLAAPLLPRPLSLPDEILQEVFLQMRSSDAETAIEDLAASLRVSKQWYRVGMPILYKHFVFDVNYYPGLIRLNEDEAPLMTYNYVPSARFYDSVSKLWSQPWIDTGIGYWIHSLSVEIHFKDEMRGPKKTYTISDVINNLPNLRTLSIRAAPLNDSSRIVRHWLTSIVESIPEKVTSFELDLQHRDSNAFMEFNPVFSTALRSRYMLCEALAKVVPQLRSLRLRLGMLCLAFAFQMKIEGGNRGCCFPNLRNLSLWVASKNSMPDMTCCGRTWTATTVESVSVFAILEKCVDESRIFPNLQHCAFNVQRNDMAAPDTPTDRIISRTWSKRRTTWHQKAFYPIHSTGLPSKYVRTDADGDTTESILLGLNERFGMWQLKGQMKQSQELDTMFEGEAGWSEDAFGARMPPRT